MRRRDFFRNTGVLTCACAFFAGCKKDNYADYDETTTSYITKHIPGWLTHVEILITHHCNLNCACCAHCAPIAPYYNVSVEIFKKDIIQLHKLTNGKIKEIMLHGGEPLLNKNIETFIELTRKYFSKSELYIVTNGLILNDMPDSFWKTCSENNVIIWQSLYALYDKYPNLEQSYKKALKYKVRITPWAKYMFTSLNLNKDIINNKEKAYKKCRYKENFSTLNNGILYPCGIIATYDLFFNKYFKDHAIPIAKDDYLDIHKLKSINEIFEFYKKPKLTCAHCDYKRKEKKIWQLSKKELSEWYNVNI